MDGASPLDPILDDLQEAARLIGRGCDHARNLGLRKILGHLERTRSSLLGGLHSVEWEKRKAGSREPVASC